ncbi:MAG TPA: hypothetical protein VH413_05650, partial [Verrucomicrobiae bacterium]|nr:hypothetical protein [Verrucomicrobiae bacterium]
IDRRYRWKYFTLQELSAFFQLVFVPCSIRGYEFFRRVSASSARNCVGMKFTTAPSSENNSRTKNHENKISQVRICIAVPRRVAAGVRAKE